MPTELGLNRSPPSAWKLFIVIQPAPLPPETLVRWTPIWWPKQKPLSKVGASAALTLMQSPGRSQAYRATVPPDV